MSVKADRPTLHIAALSAPNTASLVLCTIEIRYLDDLIVEIPGSCSLLWASRYQSSEVHLDQIPKSLRVSRLLSSSQGVFISVVFVPKQTLSSATSPVLEQRMAIPGSVYRQGMFQELQTSRHS